MKYPSGVPLLPIASDIGRCKTCRFVYLDIDGDPDSSHCAPMVSEEYSLSRLTSEQLGELSDTRDMDCPLYEPND